VLACYLCGYHLALVIHQHCCQTIVQQTRRPMHACMEMLLAPVLMSHVTALRIPTHIVHTWLLTFAPGLLYRH
jgi:hypothetical protein